MVSCLQLHLSMCPKTLYPSGAKRDIHVTKVDAREQLCKLWNCWICTLWQGHGSAYGTQGTIKSAIRKNITLWEGSCFTALHKRTTNSWFIIQGKDAEMQNGNKSDNVLWCFARCQDITGDSRRWLSRVGRYFPPMNGSQELWSPTINAQVIRISEK